MFCLHFTYYEYFILGLCEKFRALMKIFTTKFSFILLGIFSHNFKVSAKKAFLLGRLFISLPLPKWPTDSTKCTKNWNNPVNVVTVITWNNSLLISDLLSFKRQHIDEVNILESTVNYCYKTHEKFLAVSKWTFRRGQ